MPKTLFYLAVVACTIVGAGLVAAAFAGTVFARLSADPGLAILLLLVTIPISAIFLRMASLLAARNLFAAFLAVFSIASAGLSVSLMALTQLRITAAHAAHDGSAGALSAIQLLTTLLVGWFLSTAFFVLRPYFRLQAGPLLSALAIFPVPLFLWSQFEQVTLGPTTGLMTFLVVLGSLFLGVAIHCLYHRHLFLEVTNLRELLYGPSDRPRVRPSRGIQPLPGDVAFDS